MSSDRPDMPPLEAALELFERRRPALVERCALDAHDVVAPLGVAFGQARDGAEMWIDAVSAALQGRYAPRAVSELNQRALLAIDEGIGLELMTKLVQAGVGSLLAVAADYDPRAISEVARAAGALGGEILATAARTLDERARTHLKRRTDRSDRFRQTAERLAEAALSGDDVALALADATLSTLDCDWSVVALRDGDDGRLTVAAVAGRGSGFGQRLALRTSGAFEDRVLRGGEAVATTDTSDLPLEGVERPAVVIAAALRIPGEEATGMLLAARDHGPVPEDDDAQLAAALAACGARSLRTAAAAGQAQRSTAQAALLNEAATHAVAGRSQTALSVIARAALEAAGADLALVRVLDAARGELVTRGVHARSLALAAELEGTRLPVDDPASRAILTDGVSTDAVGGGPVAALVAERLGDTHSIGVRIEVAGRPAGTLVLARRGDQFLPSEFDQARATAAHAAMLLELAERRPASSDAKGTGELGIIRDIVSAAGDESRIAGVIARLACQVTAAQRAVLYRGADATNLELLRGYGFRREELAAAPGRALAVDAMRRDQTIVTGGEGTGVAALAGAAGLPAVVSTPLTSGGRSIGVLQLFFEGRAEADAAVRGDLAPIVAAAADALARASAARRRDEDLRRTTALLDVAARASSNASLEQTLIAVGAHLATVVPAAAAGVFVVDEGRVTLSEPRSAPHGPFVNALLRSDPAFDYAQVADATTDRRLDGVGAEAAAAGIRSLLVVPLRFRDAVIGAIAFSSAAVDAFHDDHIALVRAQVPPIVLAIGSAVLAANASKLEQDLSAALAAEHAARVRLQAREAAARAVASDLDGTAARDLAESLTELVAADAAFVLRADGSKLTVVALHSRVASLADPLSRMAATGTIAFPARLTRALAADGAVRFAGADAGAKASALAPLLAPGSTLGLASLGDAASGFLVGVASLDPARPIDDERLGEVRNVTAKVAQAR